MPWKTPPDHVIYGSYLRNEAAFEKLALQEEAAGRSGSAYRDHFIGLYGLTAREQNAIAEIALEHDATAALLRRPKSTPSPGVRQDMFPGNRHIYGKPAPTIPSTILTLRQQLIDEELATRDKVHQALGDSRFAHLDAALRAYARHDFKALTALKGSAQ